MLWPADHPVIADPRLAGHRADADAVLPVGVPGAVLRHVDGRRVATLVTTPAGPAVHKVFASRRGAGNHERLKVLRAATGPLVPRPLAVGPAGHAMLVEYVPGPVLARLTGPRFVSGCHALGAAVALLHASGAQLDRVRTARDELDALGRHAPPVDHPGAWCPVDGLVPSHRDLHPAQVVVAGGVVHLIDLDDAAMAPRALDVDNFLAHLDRDAVLGHRPGDDATSGAEAFLRGYGSLPRHLAWWRRIALVRLAVLAEERHGRADWARSLRAVVG